MSLTQTMKNARAYINNAEANLVDSMQSENPDPDYSLRLAISELQSAMDSVQLARKIRQEILESK